MPKIFNPIIWIKNDICACFDLKQDISNEIKHQINKINNIYKKDKNLKRKSAKLTAVLNAIADNTEKISYNP